ncbi:MAG: beta strand repeat-containing protein, partial [Planctomycetota bacterium]
MQGASDVDIGSASYGYGNVVADAISFSKTSGTTNIKGNFIGVTYDSGGWINLGFGGSGIAVGATGTLNIGGSSVGGVRSVSINEGNYIGFNDTGGQSGIYVADGSPTITGNYIGTNKDGDDLGNHYGIYVQNGSDNVTIGSATYGYGNVIGHSDGYEIYYRATTGTQTIKGNFIGTTYDAGTWRDLAPQSHGIYVDGGGGLTIGGTSVGGGNSASVVSRINEGNFISFHDTASMAGIYVNNGAPTIQGNYIGTNRAGNDHGNVYGIQLAAGADNVTIGGPTYGLGNVIGQSDSYGIYYQATGGSQTIKGCFIGTTYDAGTWKNLAPQSHGIYIDGAGALVIGGRSMGHDESATVFTRIRDGNFISYHDSAGMAGIYINNGSPTIAGNYIGTNRAGDDHGNVYGIQLASGADNVTIGTSTTGAGNTIGHSDGYGIYYQASGGTQTIKGNFIGITHDAGTWRNLAPQSHGIYVDGAGGLTIGGASVGSENSASVVSRIFDGNYIAFHDSATRAGIYVNDGAPSIQGNYIGTNRAGGDLGNVYGIQLASGADNVTIGTSTYGQGNVIGGSDGYQIYYQASGGTQSIRGNFIGTTYDAGTWRDLAPSDHGIYVDGAGTLTIGGTSTGSPSTATSIRINEGNFVAFHDSGTAAGIFVYNGSPTITGNFIGTNRAGTDLGNDYGLYIDGLADNVTFGTATYGQGNIIGHTNDTAIYYWAVGGTQTIKGNYIGTTYDAGTWRDLNPGAIGIKVDGAGALTIGGTHTGSTQPQSINEGNYICFYNGALETGFWIESGAPTVKGNFFGTNRAGDNLGNYYAVYIGPLTGAMAFGAGGYGQGNVIGQSGSYGMWIDAQAGAVSIKGNFIGTTYDSGVWIDLAPSSHGLWFNDVATNVTVGGVCTGGAGPQSINEGNHIAFHNSANAAGVQLNGGAPTILGNYFGTNRAGSDLGNTYAITLGASAGNATIGGTTYGQGNTIGWSDSYGIYYLASGGTQTIKGNFIGATYDATWKDLSPGNHGIYVNGTGGLTVGGVHTGSWALPARTRIYEGNFIAAHDTAGQAGIYVNDGGPTIQGNYIGTDRLGQFFANDYGIYMAADADGVTIGGTTYGQGNVVGANLTANIYYASTSASASTIKGNYIGTTYDAGTWFDAGLGSGNSGNGITVSGTGNLTIGGTSTGGSGPQSIHEGNYICFHNTVGLSGISIADGSPTILGNYIGTNRSGSDMGNYWAMYVGVNADNCDVGRASYGQGNVMGWSDNVTINYNASGGTQNFKGNYIGTTYDAGTWRDLGNANYGFYVNGQGGLIIGGAHTGVTGTISIGDGNHIAFHDGVTRAGIYVNDGKIAIQGNYIGTSRSGADLSNAYGVQLAAGCDSTSIGGTAYGTGNVIGQSTSYDIYHQATSGTQSIQGNYIGTTYDSGVWRDLGSASHGVYISGVGSTVNLGGLCTGGSGPQSIREGNYIAFHDTVNMYGIYVNDGAPTIQGNFIGTNRAGANLGNYRGIFLNTNSDGTAIGSSTYGRGNTIGRSASYQIECVATTAVAKTIQGNFIGTTYDSGVWRDLAPAADGIFVNMTGTSLTIGGLCTGGTGTQNINQGNYIAFHDASGVSGIVVNNGSPTIRGNYIGTNRAGSNLGNETGILINGGADNFVLGGSTYGQGNTIGFGTIPFNYAALAGTSTLTGNFIGVTHDAGVWRNIGPTSDCIYIDATGGTVSLTIGGATVASANYICHSPSAGIRLYTGEFIAVQANYIGTNGVSADLSNDQGIVIEEGGGASTMTIGASALPTVVRGSTNGIKLVAGNISQSNTTKVFGNVATGGGTWGMGTGSLICNGDIDMGGCAFDNGTTATITCDSVTAVQTIGGITEFESLHYAGKKRLNLGSWTINDRLVVESGSVSCPSVTVSMANGAQVKVGRGLSFKGVLTLDGSLLTSTDPGNDRYEMSIEAGGDLHARRSRFDSISSTGMVFKTDSRLGSQWFGHTGVRNFTHVTFDNIPDGGYGLNLSLINDNEDEGIPNSLSEVRFDKQAGATTAQNVLGA